MFYGCIYDRYISDLGQRVFPLCLVFHSYNHHTIQYLIILKIMSTALNQQPSPSFCIEAVPRKEKKWLSLLSLRFGAVLCTMIGIVCFAWAMVQHQEGVISSDGLGEAWSTMLLGTVSANIPTMMVLSGVVKKAC